MTKAKEESDADGPWKVAPWVVPWEPVIRNATAMGMDMVENLSRTGVEGEVVEVELLEHFLLPYSRWCWVCEPSETLEYE